MGKGNTGMREKNMGNMGRGEGNMEKGDMG